MSSDEEIINFNVFQTKPGYTQRWIGSLVARTKEQALEKARAKFTNVPSEQVSVIEDDGLL